MKKLEATPLHAMHDAGKRLQCEKESRFSIDGLREMRQVADES